MLILECPYCGTHAEETELHAGGQAHITRETVGANDAAFEQYLFTRANPRGVHLERWRHANGCGKWFHAARSTTTLEVYGTYSAQTTKPPKDIVKAITEKHPDWTYANWLDAS